MKNFKMLAAVFISLVLQSGPTIAQASCPNGFSAVDDKCFQFVLEEMSWSDAETSCKTLGGYLAILNDCRLWVDVVKKINAQGMKSVSFWIGATDLAEEGVWLWLNGENVEMGIPFWGWNTEYPEPEDGTIGNCACLSAVDRHYFHNDACYATYASICQVEPTLPLQMEEWLLYYVGKQNSNSGATQLNSDRHPTQLV